MVGWDDAHAFGTVDYSHHIAETSIGILSAFTHGWGGASMSKGKWAPEVGVTGGLELRW